MSGKAVLSDEDVIEVEEDEREVPEGYAVDPEDRHDEDDEEDEEGEDEYEKDGFIVDDVDEDEADSDEERQRKKKRKKRGSEKNYVLDEDDYELLQDNNVGFQRPKQSKYKRLKKARAEDADIGEEDEMADFIVDEEEVDEHGEPTRKRKVNKKKNRQAPGVSSSAMQEAYEIFGDVFELIKKRKLGLERINRYADAGEWQEKKLEDESERMQFKRPKRKSQSSICSKSGLREVASKFGCISEEFGQLFSLEQMVPILTSHLHKFKPRMIVHPRFRNISADESVEMLRDKEAGESIVRPSSRGYSYLTLTLKIYDGVYAHKYMTSLGKTLKIGEDVFEDLDEVMDRYVDPLVTHLKTMLAQRKFREGGKTEVDKSLRKEKNEYPSRIVYAFGISHEHPGTFILTYIRSSNPHHEYVGLYPKGFKFRNKMFEKIDKLVAYFQ